MLCVKHSKDPRSGIQNGYKEKKTNLLMELCFYLDFGFLKFYFSLEYVSEHFLFQVKVLQQVK